MDWFQLLAQDPLSKKERCFFFFFQSKYFIYFIDSNCSLTVSDLVFDIFGRFNHTGSEWEVPTTNMNFTITGISGGFENLTDNFFNDLLNLSGPEILELAWPGLQPTVEETVGWVSINFSFAFLFIFTN